MPDWNRFSPTKAVNQNQLGCTYTPSSRLTITKNGYVPKVVTIATGDTVQFTNSDVVTHQIVRNHSVSGFRVS